LPEVDDAGEEGMAAVVRKFRGMTGLECGFDRFFTVYGGYSHCLLVVAESAEALRNYLHSDFHLKDWMAAVKPYLRGILVFDSEMKEDLGPVVSISLLAVDPSETRPPQGALPHLGSVFLKEVKWPDKTNGFTHCLNVSFQDRRDLLSYLISDDRSEIVDPVAHHPEGTCLVTCNTDFGQLFKA